nr:unnamed protein product [Callosobruchus analis]
MNVNLANYDVIPDSDVNGDRKLVLGHLNIRSILNKIEDLKEYLINSDFDIFCISESWLCKDVSDLAVNIEGYKVYRQDREQGRGGGVMIYVKNCYYIKHIVSMATRVTAESCTLLDHIWTNASRLVTHSEAIFFPELRTDHHLVYCFLDIQVDKSQTKYIYTRNLKGINMSNFENHALRADWNYLISLPDIELKCRKQNIQEFIFWRFGDAWFIRGERLTWAERERKHRRYLCYING